MVFHEPLPLGLPLALIYLYTRVSNRHLNPITQTDLRVSSYLCLAWTLLFSSNQLSIWGYHSPTSRITHQAPPSWTLPTALDSGLPLCSHAQALLISSLDWCHRLNCSPLSRQDVLSSTQRSTGRVSLKLHSDLTPLSSCLKWRVAFKTQAACLNVLPVHRLLRDFKEHGCSLWPANS